MGVTLLVSQEMQDGEIELPWILQKGEMAGVVLCPRGLNRF
jgi:hypothetical protein